MVGEVRSDIGVGCVIVTFHPRLEPLERILKTVSPQVEAMVIVDNGSPESTLLWLHRQALQYRARLFPLGANLGLAAAQNVGIRWLKALGCPYVLFLDQDSVPHPQMLGRLLDAMKRLEGEKLHPAAVGPRYRDPRTGRLSRFIQFAWGRPRAMHCQGIVPVDFLIASGMVVPLTVLEEVGGMDEHLFIDHVDTDWFLRAKSRGYRAYGVCSAWMEHRLGEKGAEFLGRPIPLYDALRYYYIFRNSLLIYRRPYASARWISGDILRLVGIFLCCLKASARGRCLKMIWQGLRDGMGGVEGARY